MFCVIPPTLVVAVIFSSFTVSYLVYVNTCSVKLPAGGGGGGGGGLHAMNNVVLTKWRIALSITSGA